VEHGYDDPDEKWGLRSSGL